MTNDTTERDIEIANWTALFQQDMRHRGCALLRRIHPYYVERDAEMIERRSAV